jgi:hypothetical protein
MRRLDHASHGSVTDWIWFQSARRPRVATLGHRSLASLERQLQVRDSIPQDRSAESLKSRSGFTAASRIAHGNRNCLILNRVRRSDHNRICTGAPISRRSSAITPDSRWRSGSLLVPFSRWHLSQTLNGHQHRLHHVNHGNYPSGIQSANAKPPNDYSFRPVEASARALSRTRPGVQSVHGSCRDLGEYRKPVKIPITNQ